jgi:hypothetical protein
MQAFLKATIVPMVRWSFVRAGFQFDSDRIDRPLTLNPQEAIARIDVPELRLEQLLGSQAIELRSWHNPGPERREIPAPTTLIVSLAARATKGGGKCPHSEHPQDEEEATEEDD